ncbi:MAG: preprotein translocase subunit SecE [Schleiferiaceae bacterium]|nr:preprotein translocase subunit SecE [Schleiferiaceae bacterium]
MGVRISPPVQSTFNQGNPMESISQYLKDSYSEFMHRVTWPTWMSLQKSTLVVIAGSLVFALAIFVMDKVITQLFDFVYTLFA